MFGRARQIRTLQARVDHLQREKVAARSDACESRREADEWKRTAAEWQRRAERIGDDRIATARELTAAQLTIAQHRRELADWSSIAINQAERHGRLIRTIIRNRAELAAKDTQITNLTRQLGVPDRAVDPARPTPELVRVTRERDEARALLRPMQDRLDAYQRASEAQDRSGAGRLAAGLSAVGGRA